jgi:xylan 1,4-beta-xylosidase
MSHTSRRDVFKLALAGAVSTQVACTVAARPEERRTSRAQSARGVEGQRRADLSDGTFLNPIVAGDRPDPTILKDGYDYYMTFSSFLAYPGAVIWHSTDLINWAPVGPALTQSIGSVWAMDLVKHNGRYYIYMPSQTNQGSAIYVVYADNIRGPWSEPVDLKIDGCIDPGHAVGEDGKRYLFFNGVRRIELTDDGLATAGALQKVYEPWRYPKEWVVEMFAAEGPKIFRRGEWFYLIAAVGGTAGPATSHMVIVARSRSIHGPWENCPHNPIVHTQSREEPWWSRGHASVVEGPAGDWWMVYHGYENGFRTLGRQTLLEPIEWTSDGWFRATGGTLSQPLPAPRGGQPSAAGFALSDDFSTDKFGLQWAFFDPAPNEAKRARFENGSLTIQGKGLSVADSSPLTFIVGDRSYEASVTLEIGAGAQGGLVLFYNERCFCGIGFDATQMFTYNYGQEHAWMREKMATNIVHLRLTNREHVVTFHYSHDGVEWTQHPWQMEVSGFHHNVFGGFSSLKVGIYGAGSGEIVARQFGYRALGSS